MASASAWAVWAAGFGLAACQADPCPDGSACAGANCCDDSALTGAEFHPPDEPGPYGASATTLRWTDARGQAMVAEVWYPIPLDSSGSPDCAPKPYPELPIAGEACRDADAAAPPNGGFPLVAFSHGNAGIRYQSIFLTEALAQHGYVVIAPDHPHNTLIDFDEAALGTVAEQRPADIQSAVDRLTAVSTPPLSATTEEGALLAGLAQTDRYGMAGHSFGGWTTLAVAGGTINVPGLRAFCADPTNIAIDYDFCAVLDTLPETASSADFAGADPRAVTALAMAPAGWYAFSPGPVGTAGGLADMVPTLLLGGTMDESESIAHEIQPLYDRLTDSTSLHGPDDLGVLKGAGHYAFTDICQIGNIQPDCDEEAGGYIAIDDAHRIINVLAIAWFGATLYNDARFQPYLDNPAWPELSWTAG